MNFSKVTLLPLALVGFSAFAMDAPDKTQELLKRLQEEQKKATAHLVALTKHYELAKKQKQLEDQLKALTAQVEKGNQELGLTVQSLPKKSFSLDDLAVLAQEEISKDSTEQQAQEQEKQQGAKRKRAQEVNQKSKRLKFSLNCNLSLHCPVCNKTYNNYRACTNLGQHMRQKHSKSKDLETIACCICNAETGDIQQMYAHMLDGHATLQCSACDIVFKTHQEFNKHIRTIHQQKED